jgi:hypothetical protein
MAARFSTFASAAALPATALAGAAKLHPYRHSEALRLPSRVLGPADLSQGRHCRQFTALLARCLQAQRRVFTQRHFFQLAVQPVAVAPGHAAGWIDLQLGCNITFRRRN